MTDTDRLQIIEQKLDRLLFLLGEGRKKSEAELQREADAQVEKWRRKKGPNHA